MQVWACVRNGYVYATEMSRVQVEEVLGGRDEARVRSARNPVCDKEKRKESAEGKRQTASQYNDSRRPYAAYNAV
jgi:hypothetical protein